LVHAEGAGIGGFDVSATFEWVEAIWERRLSEGLHFVLVAEDEQGIHGVLPCLITWFSIGGLKYRKLVLISSVYELRTGLLVGGNPDVLNRFLGYIFDDLKGWDCFEFRVVDESPSHRSLNEAMRRRAIQPYILQRWSTIYYVAGQSRACSR